MIKMKNNKSEMGMGTLIIFIAMILVAAVAASVLLSTTSRLQNKALETGKATSQEIGTSMQFVELVGNDGRTQKLGNWFLTLKLSSGSEQIKLSDLLLTFQNRANKDNYRYINSFTWDNFTKAGPETHSNYVTKSLSCDDLTIPGRQNSSWCLYSNRTRGVECLYNNNRWLNNSFYSAKYLIKGPQYKLGYLNKGDTIQICLRTNVNITEGETISFTLIPSVGNIAVVEAIVPDNVESKYIKVFP
jgi:archaeal flagellin FlaB